MTIAEQARKRWDSIAKPLHSLGRLEDLVVQMAGIMQTANILRKMREDTRNAVKNMRERSRKQ